MKKCVICEKRIWFWQKRVKFPNPFTGETTKIVLPLHFSCNAKELKEIVHRVIREYDEI